MSEWDPDWSVHPGETLGEFLKQHGISQTQLARDTGVTLKHVNAVVKGRARITPQFALRLERALGAPSAEFWGQYQLNHDFWVKRHAVV